MHVGMNNRTAVFSRIREVPLDYKDHASTLVADGRIPGIFNITNGASVMRVLITAPVRGAELRQLCEGRGWSVKGRSLVVTKIVNDQGITKSERYAPRRADSAVISPMAVTVEYTKPAGARG